MPAGVFNPCHIPTKGNYFDPETGYAGMPAPPAESIEARRLRELTDAWKIFNYDLAEDAAFMQGVAPQLYQEMQQQVAEGETPEVALANITAAIRRVRPRPTDELKYRADAEVARIMEERRRQGQGLGVRPRT